MRSILLFLLGVPIPIIILIALVSHCLFTRCRIHPGDRMSPTPNGFGSPIWDRKSSAEIPNP